MDNVDWMRQYVSVYHTHSANMACTHGACDVFTRTSISLCHITAWEIYNPMRCTFSPPPACTCTHLSPFLSSSAFSSPKTEHAKRFYNSLLCWINVHLSASATARGVVGKSASKELSFLRSINQDFIYLWFFYNFFFFLQRMQWICNVVHIRSCRLTQEHWALGGDTPWKGCQTTAPRTHTFTFVIT